MAKANGAEVGTVVDAMVSQANAALDQAVEDGRLTEAEADEKRADSEERINANSSARAIRRWGPGHDRGTSSV